MSFNHHNQSLTVLQNYFSVYTKTAENYLTRTWASKNRPSINIHYYGYVP